MQPAAQSNESISAAAHIDVDDLLTLYRRAAVYRNEEEQRRASGKEKGVAHEFWNSGQSDLKERFMALLRGAKQRSAQAGKRDTAEMGVALDFVIQAVRDRRGEIVSEEILSCIMWQKDYTRYEELASMLNLDEWSSCLNQLDMLLEFIKLDLRFKNGDSVQWVKGTQRKCPEHRRAGGRGSSPATPAASERYVTLPLHRVAVLEEGPYCAFEAGVKNVEFRHGSITSVRPGMTLLFALSLALRRVGRTGLLLAEVTEVLPCSVEEAYTRFPTEAHRCNLRARSARRSRRTVTCIVVQNVRPAPEFSFLVPGNLGFMHQFSLDRGTPQFCLTRDLNKTVSVVRRSGQTAQRTLTMSTSARIGAAPSDDDGAVAHVGSAASPPAAVITLSDSPPALRVDLTAGKPNQTYTTSWHPFANFLDGSPVSPASCSTMHEFVEKSLNTLFEESLSHNTRKAICKGMLGMLEEEELPPSPHMLSLGKLKTLGFGQCMHGDYVDLFLLLFSHASGTPSHKLLNHHMDLEFRMLPKDCPFALRGSETAPRSIVLHGIHLFEQIDQEKRCTAKFQTDCGNRLSEGGIAVGVRGRSNHFQAYVLDVQETPPKLSLRCSMGWKMDSDTAECLNSVARGIRKDNELTVEITNIAVAAQLKNECGPRAVGDACELALRLYNGDKGLEGDRELDGASRAAKKKITVQTNEQGERLRMFMILSIVKSMSAISPPLYPDISTAIQLARASSRRGNPSRGPVVDLSSSPSAVPASSPAARRQVLHQPHPHHLPTHSPSIKHLSVVGRVSNPPTLPPNMQIP
jgi:hypothetical protein